MQTKLIRELNKVLKAFPQFWNGDELHRSKVVDAIENKKPDIIKALVENEKIKTFYGTNIDGIFIFDFDKLCKLLKYKEYWANSFTKYRNKLGLTSDGKYLDYSSDVVLDFPFKDCVLEGGMTKEDQGKDEIYYNEIIAHDEIDCLFSPKVFTNAKRYTKNGVTANIESYNNDDNLIIKGNNLIALHSLKERYAGQIKLIYIDPPYNTGSDSFKYNDRFNRSSWLTFMKNRLDVARSLLMDEGIIFIHCDDNEQAYLKVLMDDIFGEENFIGTIPRKTRNGKSDVSYKFSQDYDWIISFTKKASKKSNLFQRTVDRKYYKSNDFEERWRLADLTKQTTPEERPNSNFTMVNPKNGDEYPVNPKRSWAVTKETFLDYYKQGRIVFPGDYDFLNITRPSMRVFESSDEGKASYVSSDFVIDLENGFENTKGNKQVDEIFGSRAFSYAKPEEILKQIISATTNEGDLVLDFHLGSGTTAAVAHKMGRRYIGIEQMDYINDITVPRLQKVIEGEQGGISKDVNWQGGGSFVYAELMELNAYFVHEIQKAQSNEELEKLFAVMKTEAHLNYQVALENVLSAEYEMDGIPRKVAFSELELHEQKQLLIEILDKNQLYVNASEMDDSDLNISESDKAFTRSFYGME
ncbi:site-specific DNA-methyltransferase [Escherichia coli]|jgi:adenine-specific DNA-methyltransferase|uniref:site-specific DNA-methyltransferase n=1 Tax=Enterobacterales TaxID=91347 RepID=UPI001D3F1F2F|nr:site-specific DNA-methyltransferase [Escherichia coli]EHC5832639.1 site-specific DNA-methyltransferase [Escherichia coli]MCO8135129.1 site-specific DNA-methyltransferase [Escherichia coli]HCQ0060926.1 site-specific DNA-methyltransferase [Escherichia coli]HCQ0076107.1 site-specific DNA-methyltransferase [Escherichia coli]